MDYRLFGHVTLIDTNNAQLLGGEFALLSDGESRSEIVVANPDTGEEERLTFTKGASWLPVFHLIETMRALYPSDDLSAFMPEGST
jgi:hypothetical protein